MLRAHRAALRLAVKSSRTHGRAVASCQTAPAAPCRGIRVWSDGLWNEPLDALIPRGTANNALFAVEPRAATAVTEAATLRNVEGEERLLWETTMQEVPQAPAVDAGEVSSAFPRLPNHHHRRHATVPANTFPSFPNGALNLEKSPGTGGGGEAAGKGGTSLWPKWAGRRGFATNTATNNSGPGDDPGSGKDFTRATFYTPNLETASAKIPTQKEADEAARKKAAGAAAPVTSFDVAESTGVDATAAPAQTMRTEMGEGMKRMAGAAKEKAKEGLSNLEEKADRAGFTGTSAAAAAAAAAATAASSKVANAAGTVRQELGKPAEEVVNDAGRAVGSAAGRVAGAAVSAGRVAESSLGGDEDIGADLRETLEVRSDYPLETGVTPPSYLQGGREDPQYRDPDELVTELEEGAGFTLESGISAPSSFHIKAPLKGPFVEGATTEDVKRGEE